jgi:hypothetical protein
METLLIFLAIIAIQMIAAHFAKQKKETVVKTIKKQISSPPQTYRHDYEEFPSESYNSQPEDEEHNKLVPQQVVPQQAAPQQMVPKQNNFQFSINEPAQGILWTAILYEPRYRVKWKRK